MAYKRKIILLNVIVIISLHLSALYGIYLAITCAKFLTVIYFWTLTMLASFGMQCGAHRLWCHRSYKAKLPLQILLSYCFLMAWQEDIYTWVRDHRLHHKYSDTDADPHNASRGFFFSHVGWFMCQRHPDVIEKGKKMDMSDMDSDPLVQFERKYYLRLVMVVWGLIPTLTPYYLWNENLFNAFFICVTLRHAISANMTFFINSAAHMWGMRPYSENINPCEATIRHFLLGEGYHNYHHTFPWDYSASEFGTLGTFNPATAFIDFFAWIGWAYDLKKVKVESIEMRKEKHGDPGHHKSPVYEYLTGCLTWSILFSPFIIGFYIFKRDV